MGTDWLEGCEDQYIVLSLTHSTPEVTMFWNAHESDYTSSIITAGRFDGGLIRAQIDRYNNGLSTVAVPLTSAALSILGLYIVVADYKMLDAFLTIERVGERQGEQD